jgi:hypothetical protein
LPQVMSRNVDSGIHALGLSSPGGALDLDELY